MPVVRFIICGTNPDYLSGFSLVEIMGLNVKLHFTPSDSFTALRSADLHLPCTVH